MGHDFNKMAENLRKHLESLTPEEKEELFAKHFPPDTRPKGWISIEDEKNLPFCPSGDYLSKGYKVIKVRYKDGTEDISHIGGDSLMWKYMAQEAGITHWFNEPDKEEIN